MTWMQDTCTEESKVREVIHILKLPITPVQGPSVCSFILDDRHGSYSLIELFKSFHLPDLRGSSLVS